MASCRRRLTATEVASEFLRRMGGKEPRESVAVTESTMLQPPEYAWGWKVECRRTDYTHHWPGGATERYPLPLMISVAGELLGPAARRKPVAERDLVHRARSPTSTCRAWSPASPGC